MAFHDTQNPGIGGLDELTTQETIIVQNIAALGDPGADRILFWDSSAGGYQFLTAGSGLTIAGTTISASGLTNPMTTGGDIIYGGVAGVPTRLANGSAGQVLQSNGTTLAPSWAAAGAGDVTKVGTPVNNQVGIWTGDGTIEGDTALTFDTTTDRLSVTTSGIIETGTVELGHASDTTLARVSAGVVSIEGNNILVSGGALGTPSSGTLTNATGLPVSGITASTVTALGVGSIELGHASDTTIARVSAGVASIEGKNIALNGTGETLTTGSIELGHASDTTLSRSAAGVLAVEGVVIPSISSTNTLTNKRVTKRVTSTSGPGATPTINTDNCDAVHLTAIAAAITSMTTNLSGTPVEGDMLRIDFTDNGTARAITWGASFESSTATLPTTTVISTRLDVGFVWNTVTSKWRCIAVA